MFGVLLFAVISNVSVAKPAISDSAQESVEVFGGTALRPQNVERNVAESWRFSADGKTLWSLIDDQLIVWSIQTGEELRRMPVPCTSRRARAFAVSPKNSLLAVGCRDEPLRIIKEDGTIVESVPLDDVSRVEWSGDVLAALLDKDLVFWSIKKNKELNRLPVASAHSYSYASFWKGHGGQWLVSGIREEGAKAQMALLDKKGVEQWRVEREAAPIAWSVDGATAFNGDVYALGKIDLSSGKLVPVMEHDYSIRQVVGTKGGWWLSDGEEVVRYSKDFVEVDRKALPLGALLSSPTGEYVLDGSGIAGRLFTDDGVSVFENQGHTRKVPDVSGGGNMLAAVAHTTLVIVERTSGTQMVLEFEDYLSEPVVRSDGMVVAVASRKGVHLVAPDGTIRTVASSMASWEKLVFSEDGATLWALDDRDGLFVLEVDVGGADVLSMKTFEGRSLQRAEVLSDVSGIVLPRRDGRMEFIPLTPSK